MAARSAQRRDSVGRFAGKTNSAPSMGLPGMGNTEYIEAMRGLRQSSATGKHDTRPNRERTRGDAIRAAVRRELD